MNKSTLSEVDSQPKNLTIEVPACFGADDLRKFREEVEKAMEEGFHPQEDSAQAAVSALELKVLRLEQENALLREERDFEKDEKERALDRERMLRRTCDSLSFCVQELRRALQEARKKTEDPAPWQFLPVQGGFTKIS